MKNDLTEIVLVLDRSGSMAVIKDDAEGGLRHLLEENKKAPGECHLTFYRFDDVVERVFDAKDVKAIEERELVLEPRNCTALLDAMGRAIDETGDRLSKTADSERPSKVIFVTVTDGMENASRRYSRQDIFDKITAQRAIYKWEFVFIGANQDAIATAQDLGIAAANAVTYRPSAAGTRNAYRGLAANMVSARATGRSMAWSEDQRKKAKVQ